MIRLKDINWNKKRTVSEDSSCEMKVPELPKENVVNMIREFQVMNVDSALARIIEPFASEMEKKPKPLLIGLSELYDESLIENVKKNF